MATGGEKYLKGATNHKRLKTTGLEQQNLCKNLEIQGNHSHKTNTPTKLIKKVVNMLKVKLEDQGISTFHIIFNDNKLPSSVGQFETRYNNSKHSPIKNRFTKRDNRNEIFLN